MEQIHEPTIQELIECTVEDIAIQIDIIDRINRSMNWNKSGIIDHQIILKQKVKELRKHQKELKRQNKILKKINKEK